MGRSAARAAGRRADAVRLSLRRLRREAHLAALAIEHGLSLCSADGDFVRFAGLRWQNPLSV